MGQILQFPLKQTVQTQSVQPDGTMLYAYILDYSLRGEVCSIYVWARDEEHAAEILYNIGLTGRIRCKLSDYVEPQSRA